MRSLPQLVVHHALLVMLAHLQQRRLLLPVPLVRIPLPAVLYARIARLVEHARRQQRRMVATQLAHLEAIQLAGLLLVRHVLPVGCAPLQMDIQMHNVPVGIILPVQQPRVLRAQQDMLVHPQQHLRQSLVHLAHIPLVNRLHAQFACLDMHALLRLRQQSILVLLELTRYLAKPLAPIVRLGLPAPQHLRQLSILARREHIR